jgi:outer membrane protein assembly factor BamE (lipoprotein component of BamABCDE complex)
MRAMVALAAGAVLASGCASIRDHRGYLADQALVDSVQAGIDNKLSVEKTLGRPTFISQFGQQDWYYLSINTKQAAFNRPRTYEQTVLRVRFNPAGNVIGVEKSGVEKVVNLSPDGHATPTLGRERSFLQDLFGNIGSVNGAGGGQAPGQGQGPNGS